MGMEKTDRGWGLWNVWWNDRSSDMQTINSITESIVAECLKRDGYGIAKYYLSSVLPGNEGEMPRMCLAGNTISDIEFVQCVSAEWCDPGHAPDILLNVPRMLLVGERMNKELVEDIRKLVLSGKYLKEFIEKYPTIIEEMKSSLMGAIEGSVFSEYTEVTRWMRISRGDLSGFGWKDMIHGGMIHIPMTDFSDLKRLEKEISEIMNADVYNHFFRLLQSIDHLSDKVITITIPGTVPGTGFVLNIDGKLRKLGTGNDRGQGGTLEFVQSDVEGLLSVKDTLLSAVDEGQRVVLSELLDIMAKSVSGLRPPKMPATFDEFTSPNGMKRSFSHHQPVIRCIWSPDGKQLKEESSWSFEWKDNGKDRMVEFSKGDDILARYTLTKVDMGNTLFAMLNHDSLVEFLEECLAYLKESYAPWITVHESLVKSDKVLDMLKALES